MLLIYCIEFSFVLQFSPNKSSQQAIFVQSTFFLYWREKEKGMKQQAFK